MGLAQIRKIRYANASAATDLATDPSGSGTQAFVFPKAENIQPEWGLPTTERKFQTGTLAHFANARLGKTAGIKFETELIGNSSTGAGASTQARGSPQSGGTPAASENGLLLKSVWGNETLDTGSTFNGAPAALTGYDNLNIVSETGFSVGGFIGAVGADGLYYARHIRIKSTGVLACYPNLPSAFGALPTSGSAYASAWYYKADSSHTFLWFDVETEDYRRKIFGCRGNMMLKNTGANGRAMMEWDFKGVDWTAPGTGIGTVTYPSSLPSTGSIIRNTRVSFGGTSVIASEFSFNLGNKVEMIPSIRATNGVDRPVIVESDRTFNLKVQYAQGSVGSDLVTALTAGTTQDILVEMTQGGPGNSFAIAMPVVEIIDVKPIVVMGLDFLDVTGRVLASGSSSYPDVSFGVL